VSDTTFPSNGDGAGIAAPAPSASPGLIAQIKARLETPEKGAATLSGTLRDYLLVTWAIPAARLRPHVPEELPLDVLPDASGNLLAFIQVVCYYHDNLHWSPVKGSDGASFHQITYRALTRYKGKRGVFDLRSYLSTDEARNALRVIAREADFARFAVHIAGDPVRGTYDRYTIRAVGDRGQTNLDITFPQSPSEPAAGEGSESESEPQEKAAPVATPFSRVEDMVHFLTQREEQYFATFLPKGSITLVPLRHEPLIPIHATLTTARASVFTDTGLLTTEELLRPIGVFVQPAVTVTAYPPRLAKFPAA